MRGALQELKESGKDEKQAKGMTPRDFFEVMGLSKEIEVDNAAGGMAFTEDM